MKTVGGNYHCRAEEWGGGGGGGWARFNARLILHMIQILCAMKSIYIAYDSNSNVCHEKYLYCIRFKF